MRKFAILFAALAFSGSAFAADMPIKMPVKAPPPNVAPAYSWAGFYVGGNAGYGWKDPSVTFTPNDVDASGATCGGVLGSTCAPPASFNINGALGGLQGGYNWQFNQNWLLGVETDFNWSGIRGTGTSNFLIAPLGAFPPGTSNFQATEDVKWFGTVRVRFGFLPTNNLLVYGTGGFAYGRVDENVALGSTPGNNLFAAPFGFLCTAGPNCFLGSSSRTATGWTAGGGLEYALTNHISVKVEYLYISLGHGNAVNVVAQNSGPAIPSSFTANYSTTSFNVVRGGVNWKF